MSSCCVNNVFEKIINISIQFFSYLQGYQCNEYIILFVDKDMSDPLLSQLMGRAEGLECFYLYKSYTMHVTINIEAEASLSLLAAYLINDSWQPYIKVAHTLQNATISS